MGKFEGLHVKSIGDGRREIYIAALKDSLNLATLKRPIKGNVEKVAKIVSTLLGGIQHHAVLVRSEGSSAAIMKGEFLIDADVKEEFYKNINMLREPSNMPPYPVCLTWIPTRKCNMTCKICGATGHKVQEMGVDQIPMAAEAIYKAFPELQFWCLLGGDVTVWGEDLYPVVEFLSSRRIFYGITSNSMWINEERAKALMDRGLSNWTVSIDNLDQSNKKTAAAMNAVSIFRNLGLDDLHCTVTVDRTNIDQIPDVVEWLASRGVWAEITPFIFAKNQFYDYSLPLDKSSAFCLQPKDVSALSKLMDYLKGCGLVHNLHKYFEAWPMYAVQQDWKCKAPWNLVVDADGALKPCLHLHGKRTRKFTIFDLQYPGVWRLFLDAWTADVSEQCQGCYWNCQFEPQAIWEATRSLNAVKQYFQHGACAFNGKV